MIITGYLAHPGCSPQGGPPEKITIGTNINEMVGLLFIAEDQGYYRTQGLEVAIKEYQTGLAPLKDLEEGRLDLASCAEFALAREVLAGRGEQLRCLAVIAAGEVDFLIARRDRGINRPGDLQGKRIGVPKKTSAEFFLAGFLTLNNISLEEVTVVDVRPREMADALAGGKVDAVLIWAPVTDGIIKKLGNNALAWPAQGGQNVYRLLVTRKEVIQKRGEVLERLLRALDRAADKGQDSRRPARGDRRSGGPGLSAPGGEICRGSQAGPDSPGPQSPGYGRPGSAGGNQIRPRTEKHSGGGSHHLPVG
jgi:NitT/TauT family transport system substrate-binding protein